MSNCTNGNRENSATNTTQLITSSRLDNVVMQWTIVHALSEIPQNQGSTIDNCNCLRLSLITKQERKERNVNGKQKGCHQPKVYGFSSKKGSL